MFLALPTGFNIGSLHIQFYAIFILIGSILGAVSVIREGRRLGLASGKLYLAIVIALPLAIVGARLWYVLFNISSFHSFGEVLGFSNGQFTGLAGLAIQGGIIAAGITVLIYCIKRKISIYKMIDLLGPAILIGQIFGRWGNFFNQELYGPKIQTEWYQNVVHGLFGEQMFINGAYRHPVFFYESMLCLIGVIFFLIIRRKSKKLLESGDMMFLYLLWYGIVRVITESLRLNSGVSEPLMMGPIPVSIAISVLFIIGGIAALIVKRFKGPRIKYYDIVKEVEENRPDTLIFDLDGTILDSRNLIYQSFTYTFAKYRPDMVLTEDDLESFYGPTLYQTFSRFSDDEAEIEEMVKYYREFNVKNHDEMVKLFPQVKDTIKVLKRKGYHIALVTSKKNDLAKRALELFRIDDCFDIVVGFNEIKNPKPAPDGILYAMDYIKNLVEVKNNEFLKSIENDNKFFKYFKNLFHKKEKEVKNVYYIGDTLSDMQAAKNANIHSIGVLYIPHPEIMLEADCDNVINKFGELLDICGE